MPKIDTLELRKWLFSRLVSHGKQAPRNFISESAVNILVLLFGMTTVVQAFVIPSGSMEDSLLIGDHVLVDKLAYAPGGPLSKHLLPYSPVKRGDIIVFRYPLDIRETYVKRVIGIPGDRIRLANKRLFINGLRVDEPYVVYKTIYIDSYRDTFPSEPNLPLDEPARVMLEQHVRNGEVVVPRGQYFALGDNRDGSSDSRFWGFVPRENIIGKPLMIYWSYDAPGDRLKQPGIGIDHAIDLAQNFFIKTRWERTFNLVRSYPLEAPSN